LIVTLGVLITVHEFGHFWVARRLGVKVLKFSIGFGRPLWQRYGRDGVEYVIAALPLGGYVKMLDEREGEVPPDELPFAFNRKPVVRVSLLFGWPFVQFSVRHSGLQPACSWSESPAPSRCWTAKTRFAGRGRRFSQGRSHHRH
jgi:hypothetical protein